MTGRAIAAIFVLIVLVITLVAVQRFDGLSPAEHVSPVPANAPRYTTSLQNQTITQYPVGYPVGYSVGALVTIDSESLTTRLANPTITETASNISEFGVEISTGKIIPPAQYDGPGSVPHQVWGGSGNTRFSLPNGHWYVTVDYSDHAPVLQAGVYTVAVYGYSYLLTYRYLTVL